MFDEDAISRIWGSCDGDGSEGGVGDENCGQKIENVGRVLKKMFLGEKQGPTLH